MNYVDYEPARPAELIDAHSSACARLMRNVYVWMTLALAVTALTAYYVATNEQLVFAMASSRLLFFGLIVGELVLVIILTARIHKLSFAVAALLFVAYSVVNGATLSMIFLAYTSSTVATAFFCAAGTFAAMAVVGSFTKHDLTKIGGLLLMALIGLIIASVVNVFLRNGFMDTVISYVGVLIFVGLTAYDAQRIKRMLLLHGTEENDSTRKIALLGSLSLYLDFINLFLYLLRIFGSRD